MQTIFPLSNVEHRIYQIMLNLRSYYKGFIIGSPCFSILLRLSLCLYHLQFDVGFVLEQNYFFLKLDSLKFADSECLAVLNVK